MGRLAGNIEVLLFSSERALSSAELAQALEEIFGANIELSEVEDEIAELQQKYKGDDFSFEIVKISEGYQFLSKPAYHGTLKIFLKQQGNHRISKAAMETLSIIAYKQPVTKSEIEAIRGVNSDYTVSKLLDREFISIVGRRDDVGQALVYGTSQKFLDHFGIHTLDDLPSIKDFKNTDQEIGDP